MPALRRAAVAGVLILGLAVGLRPAGASPDLAKTLNQLKREGTAEGRLRLVRRLGSFDGDRAAKALADLVLRDPAAGVRMEAAKVLGGIRADDATALLVGLVRAGGPRAVRIAVASSLGRRKDGLARLRKALGSGRRSPVDRGLLVRALAGFRDEASREDLRMHLRDEDAFVAGQAARALLERSRDEKERRATVILLLTVGRTIEQLMPALDAADLVLDPSLEPALTRAATFLEPVVQAAARHLLDQLATLPPPVPAAGPPGAGGSRYAEPEPPPPPDGPPPPPAPRGRIDTVYVLDATGSTDATLDAVKERIVDRTRVLIQAGVNARAAVLLYRGGKRQGGQPFEVFPLSYDIQALRAWLDQVEPRGVDDRGMRVGEAIRAALARTAWRWRAQRTVHVFADGPCGDMDIAVRAITVHFRADRTRTRFSYVARTRASMPSEYEELARLGGTGTPEVIR